MKCPYCDKEMKVGYISQDRYGLKWIPGEKKEVFSVFNPFKKGILLTSMLYEGYDTKVKVFYCEDCRKFIIDQDDLWNFDTGSGL